MLLGFGEGSESRGNGSPAPRQTTSDFPRHILCAEVEGPVARAVLLVPCSSVKDKAKPFQLCAASMLLDLGEGSGGRGNGSPAPGRPPPSSLHASCVLKSTPLNAFASLQCAVSTQPVDARAVCDTSGARGGFFRRRGRAADATAARPMHAPSCASLCVCLHHLAVVCTAQ